MVLSERVINDPVFLIGREEIFQLCQPHDFSCNIDFFPSDIKA